jgi:hypothetical protein
LCSGTGWRAKDSELNDNSVIYFALSFYPSVIRAWWS